MSKIFKEDKPSINSFTFLHNWGDEEYILTVDEKTKEITIDSIRDEDERSEDIKVDISVFPMSLKDFLGRKGTECWIETLSPFKTTRSRSYTRFKLIEDGLYIKDASGIETTISFDEYILFVWWDEYKKYAVKFNLHEEYSENYLLCTEEYGLNLHKPNGEVLCTLRDLLSLRKVYIDVDDNLNYILQYDCITISKVNSNESVDFPYADDLAAKLLFAIIEIKNKQQVILELTQSLIVESEQMIKDAYEEKLHNCEISHVSHTRDELFHDLGFTEEEMQELDERIERQLLAGPNKLSVKEHILLELLRIKTNYSEPNWDGAGAVGVSEDTLKDVAEFAELISEDSSLPIVSLAADGEICLLWKNGNENLDVGFYGDCKYTFCYTDETGEVHVGGPIAMDDPKVIGIINKFIGQ
jgi:hypothetical protein